jgi:hypothetical protein
MKSEKPKMVIGIDQSYDETGIGISVNGKCVAAKTINMNKKWFRINDKIVNNQSVKRRLLKIELRKIFKKYKPDYNIVVIFERIRTFSGKGSHINPNYIKVTGALVGVIVDACFEDFIECYSVDTRSWKSRVVGTSKSAMVWNEKKGKEVEDKKLPTLNWVNKQIGKKINPNILKKYANKDGIIDNDNLADGICISLYGFLLEKDQLLEREDEGWGKGYQDTISN